MAVQAVPSAPPCFEYADPLGPKELRPYLSKGGVR